MPKLPSRHRIYPISCIKQLLYLELRGFAGSAVEKFFGSHILSIIAATVFGFIEHAAGGKNQAEKDKYKGSTDRFHDMY